MSEKPYLRLDEVAGILDVSVDTVRNYISRKNNPLPAYKFGREYRVNKQEFEKWVGEQRVHRGSTDEE